MQPGNIWQRWGRIDWLRPSVIALVLSNLVPIAGVFLFHWDVFPLLFLFWLENVVFGAINVAKIVVAGGIFRNSMLNNAMQEQMASESAQDISKRLMAASLIIWAVKLFIATFFCVHYGVFTIVHGILLVGIFGGGMQHGFLNLPMVFQIIHEDHLQWPLAALVISHLFSFGYDYLWQGEFRRTNVKVLMNQPYSRVIVMHLTIIFGGFLMLLLKSPAAGLVFLVCLKIIFDLHGQQKEREKFAATEDEATSTDPIPIASLPQIHLSGNPAGSAGQWKPLLVIGCVLLFVLAFIMFVAWSMVSPFFAIHHNAH